jgi:hypothetical protein
MQADPALRAAFDGCRGLAVPPRQLKVDQPDIFGRSLPCGSERVTLAGEPI